MDAALTKKAGRAYVDDVLARKADSAQAASAFVAREKFHDLEVEVTKKADLTYVERELRRKVDRNIAGNVDHGLRDYVRTD